MVIVPMNKLIKVIKASILCIRFPFLYPRNRFTGKHYNNWKICEFHRKWYKHTQDSFIIKFTTEEPEGLEYIGKFDEREYRIDVFNNENKLCITDINKPNTIYSSPISYFGKGEIIKTGWVNQKPYCIVKDGWQDSKECCHLIVYTHAKWLYNLIKFFDWINDYPLQWFHCIPDYTELDNMEPGWRKAFGIKMCKDIKRALKKQKGALKHYRIMQIKEKYGGLRWYDAYGTKEVDEVIEKYKKLSFETCIDCGKPSTCISAGYISPYCDNCKYEKHNYVPITEENAWDKAYTYYWPKD